MIQKRTQQKITMGKFVLPIVILFSIAAWFGVYYLKPAAHVVQSSSSFWNLIINNLPQEPLSRIINFVFYAVVGYFLIEFNNAFAIIRLRATIQTSVYFIVVAACPQLYPLHAGSVVAFFMTTSIYFLFRSYQHVSPSRLIFHSWLFLGLSTLLFPQFLFLIPLYWIAAYNFLSLNPRSFFAGLIGLSVPYWFFLGYAFYFDQIGLVYKMIEELCTFEPIQIEAFQNWQIATFIYLFILFMVAAIHSLATGWQDKIRTRSYLNFFILLEICLTTLIVLQPHHFVAILPLLLVGFSFLAGHFFALSKSRISNVYFTISLLGLITLFLYNLWVL